MLALKRLTLLAVLLAPLPASAQCTAAPHQCALEQEWAAATTPAERAAVLQGAIEELPSMVSGEQRPVLRLPYAQFIDLADHDGDGVAVRVSNACIIDLEGAVVRVPPGTAAFHFPWPGSQYASVRHGAVVTSVPDPNEPPPPHMAQDRFGQPLTPVFWIQAHGVRIYDLRITRGDTAFYIDTGAGENANNVSVRDVSIIGARVGIRTEGGDANGGVYSQVEVIGGERCFVDDSFLGNVSLGVTCHSQTGRTFVAERLSSYGTHLGMYAENDVCNQCPNGIADAVQSNHGTTFVGGSMVAHVRQGSRVGGSWSRLVFGDRTNDGGFIQLTVPEAGGGVLAAMSVVRMNAARQVVEGFDLRWHDIFSYGRVGFHIWTGVGYQGQTPVPRNGVVMPLGWGSPAYGASVWDRRPVLGADLGDANGDAQ